MKTCLNCGNGGENYLCESCKNIENLKNIRNTIVSYTPKKYCGNKYIDELATGINGEDILKDALNELIELFERSDVRLEKCIYLFFIDDKENFEAYANEYLNVLEFKSKEWQIVVYILLWFYIAKRNSFHKQELFVNIIKDTPGLCPELYIISGKHFSQMGDFDIADQIFDETLKFCTELTDADFLNNITVEEPKIQSMLELEKLKELNERYRSGKPYKPGKLENKIIVAEIFKSKGLEYPYDLTPPKPKVNVKNKIKERDYPPITESMEINVDDYVVFWCEEEFNLVASDIKGLAALKIKNGEIVETFYSEIKPWSKSHGRKYDDKPLLNDVIVKFYDFIEDYKLVSIGGLGKQLKLLKRALRYAPVIKENNKFAFNPNYLNDNQFIAMDNKFIDVLDLAAEVDDELEENNTFKYLLKYFNMDETKDTLEIVKQNYEIYEKLKEMDV